ncbi:hypothetical protein Bpfe_005872 [Biomphalaria pfeifferi]|uniref:Uncharacterized protein n=1 Tax=Biomphalaria pfeifferi TaxID=112525 RepID=A0AAD8C203_BIOPF|nr:hypothetical protein Bpfe_005872 [Biomphalaria pfeifferi]
MEVLPVLPHPVSSPPGIETILVNGQYVQSLFDTGCAVSSVICKALVDLTDRTVTIQSLDREIPPKVLPITRVHVECKFVHGTIDAVVMDTPVYDFILGSKYVPLGVVNKPYFYLPVGRSTKQKSGSNQQVGSPGRHTHTPSPDSSAKLKPLRPGIDTARKSQVKPYPHTREGLLDPGYSAKIMRPSPDIDHVRKSQGKPNPRARENTSHHGSSATTQYQPSPGIDCVRKPRCKPDYSTRGDVLHQNSTSFIRPLFPDIDHVRRNRGKLTTYSREEAPHVHMCLGCPVKAPIPIPSPPQEGNITHPITQSTLPSNPKCFTQVTTYSGTGSRPKTDLDRLSSWHGYPFIFPDFFSNAVITTDSIVRVTSVHSHFMNLLR